MYLLSSIPHVVTLIAPPFANLFMRISIWLPFEVACGILVFTYLVIWLMPESLKHPSPNQVLSHNAQAFERSAQNIEENEPLLQDQVETSEEIHYPHDSWMRIPREIMALFRVPNLPFIFYTFFFKPIALISKAFIFQHASESFEWKISQTTWLRVSQALGSAIITVMFLPVLSAMLIRRGFHPQKLDLGAIRWSIGIAVIGFGILWVANASWLLVFGETFLSDTHQIFDAHHRSRLIHLWTVWGSWACTARSCYGQRYRSLHCSHVHHTCCDWNYWKTHRRTPNGFVVFHWAKSEQRI